MRVFVTGGLTVSARTQRVTHNFTRFRDDPLQVFVVAQTFRIQLINRLGPRWPGG